MGTGEERGTRSNNGNEESKPQNMNIPIPSFLKDLLSTDWRMYFYVSSSSCFGSSLSCFEVVFLRFEVFDLRFRWEVEGVGTRENRSDRRERKGRKAGERKEGGRISNKMAIIYLLGIKILSKARTQNVFWLCLTFGLFWDFWDDRRMKICPWMKKDYFK